MGKVILLMKRCDHADKVQIVLQKIRQKGICIGGLQIG